MSDAEHNEHSVQIEKEKTKRLYALIGGSFVTVVVVISLFIWSGRGGKVEGPGFKIDIPLIDQVSTEKQTASLDSGDVTFTTSAVPDSVVEAVAAAVEKETAQPIRVDEFTGKNLIDRKAGFVIAAEQPKDWTIVHNDSGYKTSQQPIVQMKTSSGAAMNVRRYPIDPRKGCQDLDCMIKRILSAAREEGALVGEPQVTKDASGTTAFIVIRNPELGSETFIKCVIEGKWWYEARADVPATATPADRREAIKTVRTFSAIAKS